ncbi:RNB domain-containing ribonuclease [Luethyella okanaganae]|uniref:DIS3-like exonuclease 1 n=1 Tax=Luethyella okanaganae TaxID=69372 RepID=A0ABW1VKB4_9MICO
MPSRRPHVAASAAQSELARALASLRTAFELPTGFPPSVLAEAEDAAASVVLPDLDRTDIDFVTIDPMGATDLDQALHLEATGSGYLVHYAIADVPAFVVPGGAVDGEARQRGQTIYAADGRIPLHPPSISDGAGSLLPGVERGAFVWEFHLDPEAAVRSVRVRRARVRSRRQYDYDEVQAAIDDGTADASLALLKVVGLARIELERRRGGASLNTPDEEIVRNDGGYSIERRLPLPVEDWNAQLSLMTGMAAAEMMLNGRVGILRTMPPPGEDAVSTFRRQTEALGQPWPEDQEYGEYLRGLDRSDPAALAIMQAATGLFRGAGYVAMNGFTPADPVQSAVGAPYAHTTAPLRRLVDRWSLVICEALSNGTDVPRWARESLGELPTIMGASSRIAAQLDSASVDRVEAALLSDKIGRRFAATVLAQRGDTAVIQLVQPAVTAECAAPERPKPGSHVTVTLDSVDIATGAARFVLAEEGLVARTA